MPKRNYDDVVQDLQAHKLLVKDVSNLHSTYINKVWQHCDEIVDNDDLQMHAIC